MSFEPLVKACFAATAATDCALLSLLTFPVKSYRSTVIALLRAELI